MSYSITAEWKQDEFYKHLDFLRSSFFIDNATPVHISIASFLQITDQGLPSLRRVLRRLSRKFVARDLVFGGMPDEPFSDKCVAVPITLCGELYIIQDELEAFCIDWNVKLPRGRNYKPHATISIGTGNARGIHHDVRASLHGWGTQHGKNLMKARIVGFDLWKHRARGRRELVENFSLQTFCLCMICDRARRLEIHGCSCTICVRSMVAQLRTLAQ
ncbi:hypothetical protein K438DRAFT_991916 [Mycena galopus ATCC 62051]|nr:hypothetical protein K438DRAFT_991916 [Mycena galopus ATCC 62051]